MKLIVKLSFWMANQEVTRLRETAEGALQERRQPGADTILAREEGAAQVPFALRAPLTQPVSFNGPFG